MKEIRLDKYNRKREWLMNSRYEHVKLLRQALESQEVHSYEM